MKSPFGPSHKPPRFGVPEEIRTPDPYNANVVRSQLRYKPMLYSETSLAQNSRKWKGKLKKREKTYLRGLFLIRNSVSHYNQGFTSKDQCTNLMNGIKNIFNNYYVKDFNL